MYNTHCERLGDVGRSASRFSLTRPSFPMAVGSDEGLALGPVIHGHGFDVGTGLSSVWADKYITYILACILANPSSTSAERLRSVPVQQQHKVFIRIPSNPLLHAPTAVNHEHFVFQRPAAARVDHFKLLLKQVVVKYDVAASVTSDIIRWVSDGCLN